MGGEHIVVKKFSVSSDHVEEIFRLVAGKNQTYQLFSAEGQLVLTGKTNQTATNGRGITLELDTLIARPGTEFSLTYQSPYSTLSELTHNLTITP